MTTAGAVAVHVGTKPHAWMGAAALNMQLWRMHDVPVHSVSVAHSCAPGLAQGEGPHVGPTIDKPETLTQQAWCPAASLEQSAAERHTPPSAPASTSSYPSVLPVRSTHPGNDATTAATTGLGTRIRTCSSHPVPTPSPQDRRRHRPAT